MDNHSDRKYFPIIDGLRAIAVLSVIAFHIGIPGASGGFAGVDVFFVISGYLITRMLRDELMVTGTISLTSFYAKRVRRLLPALLIVLLVTMLAGAFILFPDELPRLRGSSIAAALAFSNVHFMQYVGGYFDPSMETMPFLHTWSLAVEEQYYLIWPLLLLLLARSGGKENIGRRIFFCLMVIALGSYLACLWYSFHNYSLAFYLMPLRAWELAIGGLLPFVESNISPSTKQTHYMLRVGLGLIALYILNPDVAQPFPGVGAVVPVTGCALIILSQKFGSSDWLESRALSSQPVRWLGLLSYSWYLWHWPVLALSRAWFLDFGGLSRNIALMLMALSLALMTYHLVERPVRYGRIGPFAAVRGTLLAGASLVFLVLAIGNLTIHFQREAGKHITSQWSQTSGLSLHAVSKCGQTLNDISLVPAASCTYGNPDRLPTFVVWGDSHAGALAELAQRFSDESRGSVLLRAVDACPALPGVTPFEKERQDTPCEKHNAMVKAEVLGLASKGISGVLLASRWNAYLGLVPTDPGGGEFRSLIALDEEHLPKLSSLQVGRFPLDSTGSSAAMEKSLIKTLTELSNTGVHIVIQAPVPELPYSGPHCLYRRNKDDCVIPRKEVENRRALAMSILEKIAMHNSAIRLWDPIDSFCDLEKCYVYRNNMLLYGDDDHMSKELSQDILVRYPDIFRWLSESNQGQKRSN